MQIAQVSIPRMFESYTASSEDYNPDELIFRCMHCGHDFRIRAPRGGMCAPVTTHCPQCRMPLHYGARNSDNVWAHYNRVVPVTMFLYLHEYKDFVKLAVYGKGLSPAPRGSLEYWQEHSYKEEFRFDVKRRRTIWTQHVKGESRQMELCAPKELIELGQSSMIFYCCLRAPDFYKPERAYLRELCDALQAFYEGEDEVLVINEPPRHGKSRTAGLFVEWILGRNPKEKIMTGSYNETLSTVFSKNVRNSIQEIKADTSRIVYSDIFPGIAIKAGDAAMNLWSLAGGYNSYLATSPTGTATGFGCSLMIIDDLIKNAEEAYNETIKEKHWDWFTNTMLSRLEEGGKIIVIMTRWASDDLAGNVLRHFADRRIRHISMKALQDDGTMLCDEILAQVLRGQGEGDGRGYCLCELSAGADRHQGAALQHV